LVVSSVAAHAALVGTVEGLGTPEYESTEAAAGGP